MHPSRAGFLQQRPRLHPESKGQNLLPSLLPATSRKTEQGWLGEVDRRFFARELAEAAQKGAIGEGLVGIVRVGWASQSHWAAALALAAHPDAVPGVARVAGVSLGRPARHIAGDPADRIQGPFLRRQVHRLPLGVVEVWLGPERLAGLRVNRRVADVEFPRAVERNGGVAERDLRNGVVNGGF